MRLQAKLALALIPLVAGPVLALGWLSYDAVRDDLYHEAVEGMDTALRLAEHSVNALVGAAKANIELFATSPVVDRYARTADEHERYYLLQPDLLRLLYSYRQAYPEYLEIRFLMPNGTEDARVAAPGRETSRGARGPDPVVLALGSDPHHLSVTLGPDGDNYALYLYRRIALPQHYGTPADGIYITRGYLALTVSLDAVKAALTHVPFDFGGHVILALPDGRVLFDSGGAFHNGVPAPGLGALLQRGSGGARALHQQWGERGWLVGSRYLEPGLYAIAGLPDEVLSGPLHSLGFNILALTTFSLLLLGAVLVGSLRRLVLRPLENLREAADQIGAGELRPLIPIRSHDELGTLAAAVRDMGERLARFHAQVEKLAFHDQLTDLPNRLLIRELLSSELERARVVGRPVAVLFLDLDNFKQINDALGHAMGDELLRVLARRLSALLEDASNGRRTQLARLGGDELLILLGEPAHLDEVADLAGSVLDATAVPFDLGAARYVVTASIGVALYPRDATDPDGLIRCADLAMYAAKAEGRNAVRCFSQELNAGVAARLRIENALRQAIGRGELVLHYQPIVELQSGRLWALEALLRWTHPELGEVSPQRFIPVAEETGLIQEIGHWVLNEACRQIVDWRARGLQSVPVSVNVSAGQLKREDLAGPLAGLLNGLGLSARDLHLEITESLLMDLSQTGNARLRALGDLGIAIHVDDFGTGYSSLSYLRHFAIDAIKIDKAFVGTIADQEEDRALVSAMIAMAHALNLLIIAEGIERSEQLGVLRDLGCDLGQGFLFSHPADADAVATLLTSVTPRWRQALQALHQWAGSPDRDDQVDRDTVSNVPVRET